MPQASGLRVLCDCEFKAYDHYVSTRQRSKHRQHYHRRSALSLGQMHNSLRESVSVRQEVASDDTSRWEEEMPDIVIDDTELRLEFSEKGDSSGEDEQEEDDSSRIEGYEYLDSENDEEVSENDEGRENDDALIEDETELSEDDEWNINQLRALSGKR